MFQVRKEKLGDRITALQQLVSPFGKVSDPCLDFANGPVDLITHALYIYAYVFDLEVEYDTSDSMFQIKSPFLLLLSLPK
jgi:hypothetical protein